MNQRQQLNQSHFEQLCQYAQYLPEPQKTALIAEAKDRLAFEQAQLEKVSTLQKVEPKRPLARTVGAIFLVLFALAVTIYWQTGRYSQVQQGIEAHRAFSQQNQDQDASQRNDRYILSLQKQLRDNPNEGNLWFELGQAYMLNNDFESALICYQNAEKVLGKRAAVLGAMATTDYYAQGQKLTPQAQQWIEQALQLDPNEASSLLVLASHHFLNNDYAQAIATWRKVLDSENQQIDRRAIIQSIQMAQQLAQSR